MPLVKAVELHTPPPPSVPVAAVEAASPRLQATVADPMVVLRAYSVPSAGTSLPVVEAVQRRIVEVLKSELLEVVQFKVTC